MKKALLLVVLALTLFTGCTGGFKAWTGVEFGLGYATVTVSTNWKNSRMEYAITIVPHHQGGRGDIEPKIIAALKKDDDFPKLILNFLDKNKTMVFSADAHLNDMVDESDYKAGRIYFTYKNTIECSKKIYKKISKLDIKRNF